MNIVIFGGGTQLQYTIDIIRKHGVYEIVGIVDSKHEIGEELFDIPVIGRQEQIKELIPKHDIEGGIIAIGDNYSRYLVRSEIVKHISDFTFLNAIHPSAAIGMNVRMGKGIIAMAGVIINPGAKIGNFTFFATGAQIEHDCDIGDFASVSAGSVTGGFVKVGKFSAVTLGCTIMDRLSIGENTVIGSGSLVTKDIGDNLLCYGSPCIEIRERKFGEKYLK